MNYGVLRTFAAANGDLLMSKSIGLPTHSGGKVYGDANSQQYKDLASLLPKLKESCSTEVLATGEFYKSVKFADDETMLGKASVLFAGRTPTAVETAPLPAAEIRYCGRRSAATCKAHPSTTSSRKRVKSSTWSTVSWYSATTVAWIQPTFRWLPP